MTEEPILRSYMIGTQEVQAPRLEPALYVVATPIGNLRDITLRALETLAAADLIACEDTRTSRTLMQRYGIGTKLIAAHQHNEASAGERIAEDIVAGKAVALISDAGTPAVSDPGHRVVQAVLAADLPVVPLPGASAMLAALVGSGLPTDGFAFLGFPERKQGARRGQLAEHRQSHAGQTAIYYESPKRVADTLAAMAESFGPDTRACMARELTKLHETFLRGSLHELASQLDGTQVRGEVVVLVAIPQREEPEWSDDRLDALLTDLMVDLPAGKAASEAATRTGRPRRELFDRATALKSDR
jgi:16S rRNA (cytidine1402-2'-O)-methyltransferase